MGSFRGSPLPFWDRIFPTQGGSAAGSSPPGVVREEAQPVVDISRLAQHGVSVQTSMSTAHLAGNTQRDSILIGAELAALAPPYDPGAHDVWLTGASCFVDFATRANFTRAILGYKTSNRPPLLQATNFANIYGVWSTALVEIVPGEGGSTVGVAAGVDTKSVPVLIDPATADAGFYMVSETSAAVTFIRVQVILRITPKGATPPGMA